MKRDVRIKLPVNGGHEFYPVDIERMDRSVLSALYEKMGPKANATNFYRIAGSESWLQTPADVSKIKEVLRDITEQISQSLGEYGEAGKKVKELVLNELKLEAFVDAMTSSNTDEAAQELQQVLYGLMGGLSEIAAELSSSTTWASGMTVAFEAEKASVDDAKEYRNGLYLEIAATAELIIAFVDKLKKLESDLELVVLEIDADQQQWSGLVDEASPELRAAEAFLDGPEESFNLRAYAWRNDPDSGARDVILRDLETARQHITVCREREWRAAKLWKKNAERADKELTPPIEEIKRHCRTLAEARQHFYEIWRNLPAGTPKPYLVIGELISKETYETAENLLNDPKWSTEPWGCERRLMSLIENGQSLVRYKPKLQSTLSHVLSGSERLLEELSARMSALPAEAQPEHNRPDKPETDSKPEPAEAAPSEPPAAELQQLQPDEQRCTQLYEMAMCVAYLITCNTRFLSTSSISALLEDLVYLGRCGMEEARFYVSHLKKRLQAPGVAERIEDTAVVKVSARWEQSLATWLIYDIYGKPVRRDTLKLTRKASAESLCLMQKHSLTAQEILEAHERKKAVQKQQWEDKRRTLLKK